MVLLLQASTFVAETDGVLVVIDETGVHMGLPEDQDLPPSRKLLRAGMWGCASSSCASTARSASY
jgi:hypothetical protein